MVTAPQLRQPQRNATQARVEASAQYLNAHLEQVPVNIYPVHHRPDRRRTGTTLGNPSDPSAKRAVGFHCSGSVELHAGGPSTWAGDVLDSLHLFFEEEVAKLLGFPYAEVMQACLIPLAYTKGTEFKPGRRDPLHAVVYWDSW